MTYDAFLAALSERRRFGVRPGLDAMRAALARLGNPAPPRASIHIAGSNGKGSTAAMCEAMLLAQGRSTLLFSSPHLSRFTERIRLNGSEISRDEVAQTGERVLAAGPDLTYFEIATAIAWVTASAHDVDVAILETGLGGRLDATNVIERPSVTVVTSISLEHADVLGPRLSDIAREKAGIFKAGAPAVVGALTDEAMAVMEARAREIGAPLHRVGPNDEDDPLPEPLSLAGAHQRANARLARRACALLPSGLAVTREAAAIGLGRVRWPARLEEISKGLWLDAAHNPEGANALCASLSVIAPAPMPMDPRSLALVFGVVQDKDAAAMLRTLAPSFGEVILTRPPGPRALAPSSLLVELPRAVVIEDPLVAVTEAQRRAPITVVAGSIFLVGYVRAQLTGELVDPVTNQEPAPNTRA